MMQTSLLPHYEWAVVALPRAPQEGALELPASQDPCQPAWLFSELSFISTAVKRVQDVT